MLKKLKQLLFGKDSDIVVDNSKIIELDIQWEDLTKESILVSAMKRNGIYGYPTQCLLVLQDGTEYMPTQLSDHWEAYINSPKFKPKTIKYELIESNKL